MLNAISSVTSGLTLAAFVVAAAVEAMRRVLASRERRIALAPESDRIAMAQALSSSFLVFGQPIDTKALTKEQQFKIIMTQIRDRMRRFYVLAVTCALIALGGVGVFAGTRLFEVPPGGIREQSKAVRLLDSCYSRDYRNAYDSFGRQIKAQMTFGNFVTELNREFGQFPRNVVYRHFERASQIGGYWVVSFLADFDSVSSVREVVTFMRDGSSWELYRLDVMPATWPQTTTSRFLPSDPLDVMKSVRGLPVETASIVVDKEFKGFFTPQPGWNVVADKVLRRSAEQTCDLSSHDQRSGAIVILRSLLGGCDVKPGERLTVLARLSNATDRQVELDAVRILK